MNSLKRRRERSLELPSKKTKTDAASTTNPATFVASKTATVKLKIILEYKIEELQTSTNLTCKTEHSYLRKKKPYQQNKTQFRIRLKSIYPKIHKIETLFVHF
jgi:hypothetical protein